jgi:hypothetical protein
MAASSGSSFDASKMAPQFGGAFGEFLITANLLVELNGHCRLILEYRIQNAEFRRLSHATRSPVRL